MGRQYFEKRAEENFHFGWAHGVYADYWTFVHILTGLAFGFGAVFFGLSFWLSFSVVLALLILYEGWEAVMAIVEDWQNALTDIVVAQVAFVVAYGIASNDSASPYIPYLLGETVVLALLLLSVGYRNFLKRRLTEAQELRKEKKRGLKRG